MQRMFRKSKFFFFFFGCLVSDFKKTNFLFRKDKKEEQELVKINSGMGSVLLKDMKEQAKIRKYKQSHIDPRNASRTPSASKEPMNRLR